MSDDEKCSICREEMDGSEPDYMLRCNHRFHTECIVNSLRKNPECPVCRDRGTDNIDYNDGDDVGDIIQYTDWYIPKHNNTCICCASKNSDHDYYDIYQMIKTIGNIHQRELLIKYRTNFSKVEKSENELFREYNQRYKKIRKIYNRHKELVYRNIGNSTQFVEYKKQYHDYKIARLNLKNAIQKEFLDMGYDIDKEITLLIYEYINSQFKSRRKWRFNFLKMNIQRYTLDKYAPKDGEILPIDTINNVAKTIEI